MMIFVRYLLDRLRLPRGQAERVLDVRRRLAAQPGPRAADQREVRLARELCDMRETLVAAFGSLQSCAVCSRPPSRDWPGGDCCRAPSEGLFTDDELAALKLSGTTPARLRPASADRDGCPFCGPSGCLLRPADRPNACVRYTCRVAEGELRRRGDRGEIAALQTRMQLTFNRFVALRQSSRMG